MVDKTFSVLRIDKLKSVYEVSSRLSHNLRISDCNYLLTKKPVQVLHGNMKPFEDYKKKLSSQKVRKNAVYALEVVISLSSNYFRDEGMKAGQYNFSKYEDFEASAYQWLNETFGESNVISSVGHLDEATPHIHALIIPIDPKNKLNAQHWIGTPKKMRDLQTSIANTFLKLGAIRGRPSKKKHTDPKEFRSYVKQFYDDYLDHLKRLKLNHFMKLFPKPY